MLKEAIALVTGGARGLGLATATRLHEHGVQVILLDKDEVALKKLPSHFAKYTVDVTSEKDTQEVINSIADTHDKINILINNAGAIFNRALINITNKKQPIHNYAEYKKIIDINMNSVFLVTSLVAEKMVMRRTKGVIVNISSICAEGNAGQSAYSAAKAGVNAFTKCWAKELGAFGIRVVAIAPGFIDTPSTHTALNNSVLNDLIAKIPLKKLGQDHDVAQAVISVITNAYINGAVVEVNGGLTL